MKWIHALITTSLVFLSIITSAQIPGKMTYQAVMRDPAGTLLRDNPLNLEIAILQGSVDGTEVYKELHQTSTNTNGLITLEIGTGQVTTGDLLDINWSQGPFFIRTATDPSGGFDYVFGVSPLLSVPYAFHAATADSLSGGIKEKDGSVLNELQELSISDAGDTLFLSKGNWVIIPGISEANSGGRIVEDEFTSQAIQGNPIGNTANRKITVYLPPGYYKNREFPVVYLLPGIPFSNNSYVDTTDWHNMGLGAFFTSPDFPAEGFRSWMDDMIQQGTLQEMILVMPDATSAYGWSAYTDSELNGGYETYIKDELVAYIDQHYKTIPNRNSRAIMGHSMGGYGAIKLAIKHPEVFGLVAANSPIVSFASLKYTVPVIIQENPNGMTGPDPSKFNTSAVYAFSAAFSPNLSNPPFYVDLPFEWPDPGIIEEVWARWLDHDPGRLLSLNHEKAKLLNGFYYDLGTNDEFEFLNFEDVSWFNLGLNFYEVGYEFQSHDGKHWSNLYERMEIALKYISDRID